jgi:hypothetical protein
MALFHYDLAGHLGMNGTEVGIRAGLIKSEGKGFVGIEDAGLKHFFGAHHGVGNIVAIGPGDFGAGRNGNGLRAKTEIIDFDFHSNWCGLRIAVAGFSRRYNDRERSEKQEREQRNPYECFHF